MKKHIILLASLIALQAFMTGCASSRSVRSETSSSEVKLYQNDKYAVELSDSGKKSIDFGPREQSEAKRVLETALSSRGLAPVANRSQADYLVRFDTHTETESDAFSATFPQRDVYVHSHNRGLSTPLGTVPTGRNTHVVERSYSVTAGGGENTDRLFVIDVIDPKTDELLWRGYTRHGSDHLSTKRLSQEIEKIIAKLPVEKKPETDDGLI